MADMELVVRLDQETLQDLYDSRYVSPHIKEVFRSATPLQRGHGDLIDKNKLAHKMIIEDVSRFKEEPEALAGLFLRMCDKEQPIIEADKEIEDKLALEESEEYEDKE